MEFVDILTSVDWDQPFNPEQFREAMSVPPDGNPAEEGEFQAAAIAFFGSKQVKWQAIYDRLSRKSKRLIAKINKSESLRDQEIKELLEAELGKASERAAERLNREADEKGLKPPTVARINAAALGDPVYRQAFREARAALEAPMPEDTELENVFDGLEHAKLMCGLFESMTKALVQRGTTVRILGDIYIAQLRSNIGSRE